MSSVPLFVAIRRIEIDELTNANAPCERECYETANQTLLVDCLRHRTRDAGGHCSGTASSNPTDGRGSFRPGAGTHDQSVCADGGPPSLLLGMAAGLRVQPAHRTH